MQLLTPTGDRNPNSHTEAEILAGLRGVNGSRRFSFRYELVSLAGEVLEPALDNVTAGRVTQNWLADIKRVASFSIRETGVIDYLSDRLKPYIRLHLEPWGTSDWVEWPQGLFILASPKRSVSRAGVITRPVEAYDLLQLYSDDCPPARYSLAAGTVITTAVSTLLGSVTKRLAPHTATVAVAREWEPGTSKLRIINDLLDLINYKSLSFDEDGVAVVQPYVAPSTRTEEWTYADDQYGLVIPEVDQELDIFSVANQWTLVKSSPDEAELISTYTNADPGSITSTVRRGRTITDFRLEQDATDQATLDAKVARLAFEASQVYEALDFQTGLMPMHSGDDVYRLVDSRLAVNAPYSEQSWELELRAGAPMKHRARRVVTI